MTPLYCRITITGQREEPHHRTDCEAPEETFRIMLKPEIYKTPKSFCIPIVSEETIKLVIH